MYTPNTNLTRLSKFLFVFHHHIHSYNKLVELFHTKNEYDEGEFNIKLVLFMSFNFFYKIRNFSFKLVIF